MAKTTGKTTDMRLLQEQYEKIQEQLHHHDEMLHAIVKSNAAILKHLTSGGLTPDEAKQVTAHVEAVSANLKAMAIEPTI